MGQRGRGQSRKQGQPQVSEWGSIRAVEGFPGRGLKAEGSTCISLFHSLPGLRGSYKSSTDEKLQPRGVKRLTEMHTASKLQIQD